MQDLATSDISVSEVGFSAKANHSRWSGLRRPTESRLFQNSENRIGKPFMRRVSAAQLSPVIQKVTQRAAQNIVAVGGGFGERAYAGWTG